MFKLTIPPLQERKAAIALLASFFMPRYAAKITRRITTLEPALLEKLQQYPWKGDIREFKNIIERAVILADADTLTADLFPPEFQQITPLAASAYSDTALSTVERNHIAQILKQTNGNKAETARLP